MRPMFHLIVMAAVAAGCQAPQSRTVAAPSARPLPKRVTGANLRAVGDLRRGYGTRTARVTMERLGQLGVNTISILMEGRMADATDTEIRPPDRAELQAVRDALLDAHALGFATVLIPHLVLDDGGWRGTIRFDDPDRADRWWRSYFAFIEQAAGIANQTGTSVLSIGVELKAMSSEPGAVARVHQLAASLRREYKGQLTYSANWDEAEEVGFWSAVDLAGVNGYYPLVPDPVRGAERVARRLTALSERAGRQVILLEVGYRSSPLSHLRPWEWPEQVDAAVDDESQAQAWAAVLAHWLPAEGVRGLLLWIVPTDPDDPASEPRHGFNPLNKPAEQVIGRAFRPERLAPVRAAASAEP